jgi:hypothetical protein
MNAGAAGQVSSVLCHNGTGWSEAYRAPADDLAMRRLYIQALPGDACERLWISQGADILWMPLHLNPMQAKTTGYQSYKYNYECSIITGRMYLSLQDVWKLYNSVKVGIANALPSPITSVEIDYQYDTDPTAIVQGLWRSIEVPFTTSQTEIYFPNRIVARWVRLRVRLLTQTSYVTPKVTSVVVEAISRFPAKYSIDLPFRLEDNGPNLLGEPDTQLVDDVLAQIDSWTTTPYPLTTLSNSRRFDGLTVLIEHIPVRPLRIITDEGREVMIAQLKVLVI